MRLKADEIAADIRAAKRYMREAKKWAVYRWMNEHRASRARTARAFGISTAVVARYAFEASWDEMADRRFQWASSSKVEGAQSKPDRDAVHNLQVLNRTPTVPFRGSEDRPAGLEPSSFEKGLVLIQGGKD